MTAPALWRRPCRPAGLEHGAPVGGLLADQFGAQPALVIGIVGVALASAGLMLSPFRRATA